MYLVAGMEVHLQAYILLQPLVLRLDVSKMRPLGNCIMERKAFSFLSPALSAGVQQIQL